MKKTIETCFSLYLTLLFLTSSIERLITANILDLDSKNAPIQYHLISLFILLFLFILSNIFVRKFIEWSVIAQLIHGKNYIGGRWVEIVLTQEGKFKHYNILDIEHGAYEIFLSGHTFDEHMNFMYPFTSLHATLEKGDQLSYTYVQRDFAHSANLDMGVLNFISMDNKRLTQYYGNYMQYVLDGDGENKTLLKQEVYTLTGYKLKKTKKGGTEAHLKEILAEYKERACTWDSGSGCAGDAENDKA